MLNLENKSKFQRDISSNSLTIYPLAVIDSNIYISTIKETIIESENNNNKIQLKDYGLKISNIKESINVKDHRFKISNLTLTLNNYEVEGERLSSMMVDKINKEVEVYFKTQSCNLLSDCLMVYKGVIKRFDHDETQIKLTLEDLTDKLVHKEVPSASIENKENALNDDYLNKPIPMVYGIVKKAPLIPYLNTNDFVQGRIYLIPDDVNEITASGRPISIGGFFNNSEDSSTFNFTKDFNEDGTSVTNPLLIFKGDYYRVLSNYKNSFDVLDGNDNGYPEETQYEISPTNNYILMSQFYQAGNAANSTAISELQTIKIWQPNNIKILSELGDVTVQGNATTSVLNISPAVGIHNPLAAVDSSTEEFYTFSSIPNNQPTLINVGSGSIDFLPDEEMIHLDSFQPTPHASGAYLGEGRFFPNENQPEMVSQTNYWALTANWLMNNAHHFVGKIRVMQYPDLDTQFLKVYQKLFELGYFDINASEGALWSALGKGTLSWQYSMRNHALEQLIPTTQFITGMSSYDISTLLSEGSFYYPQEYLGDFAGSEPTDAFKQSWANVCNLSGNETSQIITSNPADYSFVAREDNNYYNNSYQMMFDRQIAALTGETDEYGNPEYYRTLIGDEYQSANVDFLHSVFNGSLGNNGEGANCYAPAMVLSIPCNANHPANVAGIKKVYLGNWNPTTMNGVTLEDDELWINCMNQDDGRPYLFERQHFHSIFPTALKNKQYQTNSGFESSIISTDFEGFWNGVPINEYTYNGLVTSFDTVTQAANSNELMRQNGSVFDGIYGYTQRNPINHEIANISYWMLPAYGFTHQRFVRSWCIYIEEDISEGVLSKLDESEYIGEYFDNSTRTILKKGTVLPLGLTYRPYAGDFNYIDESHGFNFNVAISSDDSENITLKQGMNSFSYPVEQLSVTMPFSEFESQDVLEGKTKTFVYSKLKINIPQQDVPVDFNQWDRLLVDVVASDVIDESQQNFLSIVDPAFGVNIISYDLSSLDLTQDNFLEWDCNPNSNVSNNLFEPQDDNSGSTTSNTLESYELSEWDSPNAFNGMSFNFRIFNETNPNAQKELKINTEIYTAGIIQFNIFQDIFSSNFYADLNGRSNHALDVVYNEDLGANEYRYDSITPYGQASSNIPLTKSSDIIYHIIEKELNQLDIVDRNRWKFYPEARNIKLAFSLTEKVNSKKLLQDLSKHSAIFPVFHSEGGLYFEHIHNNYDTSKKTIITNDLIKIEFTRTPVEDIYTLVNVKYNKDYESGNYQNETGYCDGYDFFGNGENNGDVLYYAPIDPSQDSSEYYERQTLTKKGYDYSSLGLKREDKILEFESDYIRDAESATILRNYLYMFNCNQHTIIKATLNIKDGIMLQIGDVVDFDKLYNNAEAYGEDYTKENIRNGQVILPFFLITSITKTNKNIKIECIQLHRLISTFNPALGSVTRKSEVGVSAFIPYFEDIENSIQDNEGNLPYNINGHITLEDLNIIEKFATKNISYATSLQNTLADITSDLSIDEYDIYIISVLLSYAMSYGESDVNNSDVSGEGEMPEITLGDINNDGQINVVDVVNLVSYILNESNEEVELLSSDLNEDGVVNVVDIVNLVNEILGV